MHNEPSNNSAVEINDISCSYHVANGSTHSYAQHFCSYREAFIANTNGQCQFYSEIKTTKCN